MIKSAALIIMLFITSITFGQAPEKMSYQAVLRDSNNNLIVNQLVGMQISIVNGSTEVYKETQSPTTNKNGLVSVEIGAGSVLLGTFKDINWGNGVLKIKTEIDPTGGNKYSISGATQMLSVPYSMYSKKAANGISQEQSEAIKLNSEKYSKAYIDSIQIKKLEAIPNVGEGAIGEYLVKMNDGTWAGTTPVIPELSIAQLNTLAKDIAQSGLVKMDARANHAMYGKNFFVFGDSHTTNGFRFYARIAQATGAIYHSIDYRISMVNGIEQKRIFISRLSSDDYLTYVEEFDTGIIANCDGFNVSQTAHAIYLYAQAKKISIDYMILANVHLDLWEFYNTDGSLKEHIPAVYLNPTKRFSRIFATISDSYNFINTNAGITEIVNECGFTTLDSTVKVQHGTAGQTLNFSFSSGTKLNINTIASIRFGSNTADVISTTLTAGMTLIQCVDELNKWAFQQYSTWVNANKDATGSTNIPLTYSNVVGGDSTGVANLTVTATSNFIMTTPVIIPTVSAWTVQFNSKNVADLRTASKWLTAGGNVNWTHPNVTLGAIQYLGKFSPNTQWIFIGLWKIFTNATQVYPDGTVNPYLMMDSQSYKNAIRSRKSIQNLADFVNGQFIDATKLCGINAFNAFPTFYQSNDEHP